MLGLLVLTFYNKSVLTTKDSTSLESVAKKAGYQGVESMVFKNSFSKFLPETFGKNKLSVVTWVVLPAFPTFAMFDSQVKETS